MAKIYAPHNQQQPNREFLIKITEHELITLAQMMRGKVNVEWSEYFTKVIEEAVKTFNVSATN